MPLCVTNEDLLWIIGTCFDEKINATARELLGARKKLAEIKANYKKYAQHLRHCNHVTAFLDELNDDCTCGFDLVTDV